MDKLKSKNVKEIWLKKVEEMDKEYYTIKDIMRITGFLYGKIYYHINVLGILEGEQMCKGGEIFFSKEAVKNYIESIKKV